MKDFVNKVWDKHLSAADDDDTARTYYDEIDSQLLSFLSKADKSLRLREQQQHKSPLHSFKDHKIAICAEAAVHVPGSDYSVDLQHLVARYVRQLVNSRVRLLDAQSKPKPWQQIQHSMKVDTESMVVRPDMFVTINIYVKITRRKSKHSLKHIANLPRKIRISFNN